jgi:flagellar biosynthetic protein FliR
MEASSSISSLLSHVVPFTLVLFRIAGVFLAGSLLASVVVPLRWRALLACALAAAAYPLVSRRLHAPDDMDLLSLAGLITSESLIGLCVGVLATLPLLCLELAGVVMGQSVGLGLARVYNPETDVDAELLSQLMLMLGSGVFVAMGGLEVLLSGIVGSFDRIPIGAFTTDAAPLDLFLAILSSGCDLAIRVALPVVASTLLLVIVLGVIGRTMPAINIMSVGFTLKLLAGIGVLAISIVAIREAAGDSFEDALATAGAWLRGQGGP